MNLDLIKIYNTYKDLDVVIGGSASMYLQGAITRIPNDIDLEFPITRSEFLNYIDKYNIKPPKTSIKLDWGFHPNLYEYSKPIYFDLNGLIIKIQSAKEIIQFKLDYLDMYSFNSQKCKKHESDLNLIKSPKLNFKYNKDLKSFIYYNKLR